MRSARLVSMTGRICLNKNGIQALMPKKNVPRTTQKVNTAFRERAHEILSDHLASKGLRLTPQRMLILDFLLGDNKHRSMEDVFQTLRKSGLGRATVFRTMKVLEECKLIAHVADRNGAMRYEFALDRPHHDHLVCVVCGKFQEVRWPEVERAQHSVCRKLGFEPRWHRHEVFGRCAACAKAAR